MEFEELKAEEALQRALDSVGTSSRVIVCGAPDEIEMLEELAEDGEESPQEILDAAGEIDAAEWFRNREAEIREDCADEEEDPFEEVTGEWPGPLESGGFTLNRDILSDELLPSVAVARVNVTAPWEIPAHFRYGGWNECPGPEEHCAIWKYWHEKYGAHIVGVSHDVIEAIVERPPATQEAAMQLAWEQYWYCSDVVEQGTQTVANLAGGLLNGKTWYFWWD
jgi:hypothetical protein